ncbi:MAG: hypothetical protein A3K10_15495 [Bacteroidetes bacterium RIFCSPLOWO2_12_FULL_31_6]|nr:MAG: hypothetical protein A3K10_15495 [Bacteroidetes bacterium RIFCSPLOWO2_12_FULL_31_6]
MKKIVISIVFSIISIISNGQITVTNTAPFNSPTYLVNNILLGNGVSASNITFAGQSTQLGFFYNGVNGVPNLGIDSGIVISTGDVNDIPIGGNQPNIGQYNGPGDPDLLTIAQSVTSNPSASGITTTNDGAFLEFDFTPIGDSVKFNFVFASEEYTTYINTVYNDIFAFFISGPGITGPYAAPAAFPNGAINVAQVPGTGNPITISTIQSGLNSQYYINNSSGTNNDFNGFTTVITLNFPVQTGALHHLKIAIADCQDDYLDTGVFLEAGSFKSIGIISSIEKPYQEDDFSIYPNPSTGFIKYSIPNIDDNNSLFIITDLTGKIVFNSGVITHSNKNGTLNLSNLSKGVYYLSVLINENQLIKKVIIY